MKISEMNLNAGFDVLEKVLPDVASILKDEEVRNVRESLRKTDGKIDIGGNVQPVLALFLGKHRAALIRIVGAITGKTEAEVMEMDAVEFMTTAQECISEDMLRFFGCCLRMVMSA